jgi:hypothetical protein
LKIIQFVHAFSLKNQNLDLLSLQFYVDDLNLIVTPKELTKIATYFKNEFEMKDLRKTKLCLGLQIKHFQNGIRVHQSTYTEKGLEALLYGESSSFDHSNGCSIT